MLPFVEFNLAGFELQRLGIGLTHPCQIEEKNWQTVNTSHNNSLEIKSVHQG